MGAVDLVRDGVTGCLIDPCDRPAYAAAIVALAADTDRRRAMSVASHRSAADFRWDTANEAVLQAYRTLFR